MADFTPDRFILLGLPRITIQVLFLASPIAGASTARPALRAADPTAQGLSGPRWLASTEVIAVTR